jgi:hypothetical protein
MPGQMLGNGRQQGVPTAVDWTGLLRHKCRPLGCWGVTKLLEELAQQAPTPRDRIRLVQLHGKVGQRHRLVRSSHIRPFRLQLDPQVIADGCDQMLQGRQRGLPVTVLVGRYFRLRRANAAASSCPRGRSRAGSAGQPAHERCSDSLGNVVW